MSSTNMANTNIQMEEVYRDVESDTLFCNYFYAIDKKRNEGLQRFKEIVYGSKCRDVKTWKDFVSSELFQSLRFDSVFIMYVYNILERLYIRPAVAKVLYYGLEYDQERKRKWEHEKHLYHLLYCKVNGITNKNIRFSIISVACLFISMLAAGYKLYLLASMSIVLYSIIYILYLKVPLYKLGKYDHELQRICKKIQGEPLLPFGCVLFLLIVFLVISIYI